MRCLLLNQRVRLTGRRLGVDELVECLIKQRHFLDLRHMGACLQPSAARSRDRHAAYSASYRVQPAPGTAGLWIVRRRRK